MTFQEWWEARVRGSFNSDSPILRRVAEAAWQASARVGHSRSEADQSDDARRFRLICSAYANEYRLRDAIKAEMAEYGAKGILRANGDCKDWPAYVQAIERREQIVEEVVLAACSTSTQIMTRETYDALKFAAEHFEGYGLSHLQHGHSWTGVGIAAVLRLLIPDGK